MAARTHIELLCPAIFGAHAWEWNETPLLMTFDERSGRHLSDSYERTCRRCNCHEVFDVPPSPP